jgi:crotonobetainyl-CoA:carnitine CoA-transferase CaiB-like acyl-CoA transferase
MTVVNGKVSKHPFIGLRVIEIAQQTQGEFTGRLLADLGAEVVKVEPAEGAVSRKIGPFLNGVVSPETSLNFRYYNTNKKSAVIEVEKPEGMHALHVLLSDADILVSSYQPSELKRLGFNLSDLQEEFPRLIIVSVTPFGLTGPWADYKSSDLVALAAGGPLHQSGYDDHTIPPIRPGGGQGFHTGTSFAYTGALLALIDRQKTGRGQLIDVAMHDALSVTIELPFLYWAYNKAPVFRQTCRHAQPMFTQPTLFLCGDGRYVYYITIVAEQKMWESQLEWLKQHDLAADLTDPKFQDPQYRAQNFHHIQNIMECFFLLMNADEAFREGQEHKLVIGSLYAPEDMLKDPHFEARKFFVEVEEKDGSKAIYPGAPYLFSAFGAVPRTAAPSLGEHTDAVLGARQE